MRVRCRPRRRGATFRLLRYPAARCRTADGARAGRDARGAAARPSRRSGAAGLRRAGRAARARTSRSPISPARRGFWTIDLAVGPGVLMPRADSETLIEAAVAHFADRAPAPHPRSRHRARARCCSPRSTNGRTRGGWGSTRRRPRSAMRGATPRARDGGRARLRARRLGGGDRRALRSDPLPTRPISRPTTRCPHEVARLRARRRRCSRARTGSTIIAGSRRSCRALLAPGGVAVIEIGATQAEAVDRAARRAGARRRLRRDLGGRPRALVAHLENARTDTIFRLENRRAQPLWARAGARDLNRNWLKSGSCPLPSS